MNVSSDDHRYLNDTTLHRSIVYRISKAYMRTIALFFKDTNKCLVRRRILRGNKFRRPSPEQSLTAKHFLGNEDLQRSR